MIYMTDRYIDIYTHIYMLSIIIWYYDMFEYYSTIIKNKILSFIALWVDLEGITLSEVRQRQRNTVSHHLDVQSRKYRNY